MTLKQPAKMKKVMVLLDSLDAHYIKIQDNMGRLRRSIGNECVNWVRENAPADDYPLWLDVAEVALWFLEDKYAGMYGIKDVNTRPGRRPNTPGVRMYIDHEIGKRPDKEAWEQLEAMRRRVDVVRKKMPGAVEALAEAAS